MGMRARIRAQSGASGTQKAQAPDLISSSTKMGRYQCDKRANEKWGILPPSANSTTQPCKRRSNYSVWKVKCLEEVGEERLSPKNNGRTTRRVAFIAVTALILLGTGAAAQEISADYSKADFAHFKTYAWASGHSADEPLNQSIVSSIDGQLSAKGLTRVSPGENPDVRVSYDVVFDHDIRGSGFRDGLRNLRWRGGSKDVLMGMLVVNLVDSDAGEMVWRGMASGDVDANASPKKHDKKIREVVQKIFRSYPPENSRRVEESN
jgi:Domain of unknown function (DUF4136)